MINYKKYQDKILVEINKELKKSMELRSDPASQPLWACILFLLKRYNKGNFFGTFHLQVLGTTVRNPRIVDQSFKVEDELSEFFDLPDFIE